MVLHTDNKFLTALLENDERLIRQLYDDCQERVIRFIESKGGTRMEGDEVFQEAILVVYRKARKDGLFLTSGIYTFIQSVSRNIWYKKLRDRKHESIGGFETEAEKDGTQQLVIQNDCYELYRKYFRQLGSECKDILKRHFAKERDKEVAEDYEIAPSLLRKRRFDCKKRLIKWIKEDEEYRQLMWQKEHLD